MGSLLYPAGGFVVLFQVITFAYASMRPELRVVTKLHVEGQDAAEQGNVEEPGDGSATGSALSKYVRTNTKSSRLDGLGGSARGSGIATGSSAGDGGGGAVDPNSSGPGTRSAKLDAPRTPSTASARALQSYLEQRASRDSEGSGESSSGGDSNRRSLVRRRSSMHGEEHGEEGSGGGEGWCPGSTFVASNWRNWLVVSTLLIETLQVSPRGWGWDHVWSCGMVVWYGVCVFVCVCVCV